MSNEKKKNVVAEKSFLFAVRVVKLYQHLSEKKKEFVLSKQILRSGTSIGANVEEAEGAISKADFSNKISIAYKEARETHYWIRLLTATGFLSQKEHDSIMKDCEELLKILRAILNKTRAQRNQTV
ncbi:MAG: four helix bundle protein [Chloroherpetonaceae bacterium]